MRRSRKPFPGQPGRGFESLLLRQRFRTNAEPGTLPSPTAASPRGRATRRSFVFLRITGNGHLRTALHPSVRLWAVDPLWRPSPLAHRTADGAVYPHEPWRKAEDGKQRKQREDGRERPGNRGAPRGEREQAHLARPEARKWRVFPCKAHESLIPLREWPNERYAQRGSEGDVGLGAEHGHSVLAS